MANSKLEFKITNAKIDNLSLIAAKSLNTLLYSMIQIVESTPNANDISIKVVSGSAVVLAEGTSRSIEALETEFANIVDNRSKNRVTVKNWREVQKLIFANGLHYEINFYNMML